MFFMKNRLVLSLLTVIFASLFLIGCAGKAGKLMDSADMSYRANNHEAALRDTVTALRLNPNYVRAQNFVTVYFKAAVKAEQNKLKMLESSSSELTSSRKFRCDEIVEAYRTLVRVNTLVSELPPLIHKKTKERITFGIRDYSLQLGEATENAAEVHYQRGVREAASSDDVETQKQAAKAFKRVQELIPGYKDAATRYDQARSAGVKKMAILTFEDKSGKARAYGGLSDTITDNIISAVLNDPTATEFLEIISRDQLEQVMAEQNLGFTGRFDSKTVAGIGEVAGVHELVVGQITQIIYTPPRPKRKNWNRQAIVKRKTGTERYVDKNGKTQTRDKYSDVKISANVVHHQVESSVTIIGSYKILNVKTAAFKKADNFNTKHEFKAEWARYSGDKGALTRSDLVLTSKEEQDPPVEDQMVVDAANKLADELAEALKAYAR